MHASRNSLLYHFVQPSSDEPKGNGPFLKSLIASLNKQESLVRPNPNSRLYLVFHPLEFLFQTIIYNGDALSSITIKQLSHFLKKCTTNHLSNKLITKNVDHQQNGAISRMNSHHGRAIGKKKDEDQDEHANHIVSMWKMGMHGCQG